MTRSYFGTDGIRGTANRAPMTPQIAMAVALAAGVVFRKGDHRHRVVIGKDTRLSGYTLEPALQSGFCAAGMDVVLTGPVPTPAVGMLVRSLRCDLGVMLSASHNPYTDNGIKLFGPDGFKLSDAVETQIETVMADNGDRLLAAPQALGRAQRLDDVIGRYNEFVKRSLPRDQRLDGLKVVVDCANGAAYRVAPTVLYELGAEVEPIGVSPNGTNINEDCGATHPAALQEAVIAHGADLGIALDGDADRVILCDEKGQLIDGDQVMALIATAWLQTGRLKGGYVIATVMSNLGLERYVEDLGLGLKRTKVGDRYVVEAMRAEGCNLGGEQSGHVVMTDFATTGDGLIAGLQVLSALVEGGRPASEVTRLFQPYPQLLENVRYNGGQPLDNPGVQQAIKDGEAALGARGRLVIRKSGTEPLIRVMAEGEDEALIAKVVAEVASSITAVVAE